MAKKTKKQLEAENRELRAKLGWDEEYSEVAELREMLAHWRERAGNIEEREAAFDRNHELARQRSDAFMHIIEAAFALLRLH